jgi:hypothetical protein
MAMGRKYATSGSLTAPNSAIAPISNIISTTAIRPMIYDIIMGSTATPADNSAKFQLQRCTTAGTTPTTTITPTPIDPGDPASTATSFQGTWATNPTLTANLFVLQWSQNQRATFRWVAAPTSELVMPATASNGLALVNPAIGGSAVAYDWMMLFAE